MNYIINKNTNYIVFNGSKTLVNENSKIIEFKGNLINEILENSCLFYGSTLKGRKDSAKKIIASRYKIPIVINEIQNIIFFNVNNLNEVYWFNFNKISDYYKINNYINIIFKGNFSKKFKLSWSIFNNQILKSSRLFFILNSRANN